MSELDEVPLAQRLAFQLLVNQEVEKAVRKDREKLAGLVEEKINRARKVQAIRKADNKDTTIQDCKIDAWESVLALLKEATE